jgi:aspartate ammonia-lyase
MANDATRFRIEHDLIGELPVPAAALWGIHTARARENFPLSGRPVHPALIHAYGRVKLACALTNQELGYLSPELAGALVRASEELSRGELDQHIVVDALQGGAGTSTNMNVNEVLANRALDLLGHPPGSYHVVSPSDHVNLHQSTTDTYPTALKVAAIDLLRELERALVGLLEAFQVKERELGDVVKVGRTELQDAVLVTLGREMGAYAEAIARDRWRIYKAEERLRTVNLGGTAIGTGLGAPRQFIFRVVDKLREVTGYGLARAENLLEATQNADLLVEVSGLMKTLATNLLKISGDLRLLGSGPEAGFGELRLPARQAGSSIMPGKVNPVIPEAVSQVAIQVMSSDQAITLACSLGSLELNPFLPLVADHLLGSLELLTRAARILADLCVAGIQPDRERCAAHVESSTAVLTALVEALGYERAAEAGAEARRTGQSIREVVVGRGWMTSEDFARRLLPEAVNRLGSVPEEP